MSEIPIRSGFVAAGCPNELVDALLDAYKEAKRRFHLGDHRPQAVEGGRFSEAAFRILEWIKDGRFTPLGDRTFNTGRIANQLEAATELDDSARLHVPRALRVIYDVRNNRDTGHLGSGDINPNLMDARLVLGVMDWVLAEFVRRFNGLPANEAQFLIDGLVLREVPVLEEIAGLPIPNKKLKTGEFLLLLLYRGGTDAGLEIGELMRLARANHRGNLLKAIQVLVRERKAFFDERTDRVHITSTGLHFVETTGMLRPG
jgi:hypothetical protein